MDYGPGAELSQPESAADRRARELVLRLDEDGLIVVAAHSIASLLSPAQMADPGAIVAAMATIAWSWRRQAKLLPAGGDDAMRLYLDAELLRRAPAGGKLKAGIGREAARIAELPLRRADRGSQYVRQGRALLDFAATGSDDPELVARKLRFGQEIIADLTASIGEGGIDGSSVHAYAAERGQLAIKALQALNLQDLFDDPFARSDAEQIVRMLTAFLRGAADGQAGDVSLASGLLRNLDVTISSLLADSDRDGGWLSIALGLLDLAGRLIVAAGIAIVVAAGSMLSVGHVPLPSDALQAVAALAIGAGCALLQRDLPALWRQPDLSRHMQSAHNGLRESVGNLRSVLAPDSHDSSPDQQARLSQVPARAFAVEVAAYLAGRPASAAQDWPQSRLYLVDTGRLQDICRQIRQGALADPAQRSALVNELDRSADALNRYHIPDNLALQPEARLTIGGRLRPAIHVQPSERLAAAAQAGRLTRPQQVADLPSPPARPRQNPGGLEGPAQSPSRW